MAIRNGVAAAIPLALALVGNATFTPDQPSLRRRAARSAVVQPALAAALSDEQEQWLDEHNPFGLPQGSDASNRTLIVRQGYTLAHNNVDLIADWVTFHLTKEYVDGTEKRPGTSAFKPDPLLPAGKRAEKADYKGFENVYDRGHQAASADQKGRGLPVIRDSFLLSNMTPQASRLNQVRWQQLEKAIQDLARQRGELWVITGPVFVDDDGDGIVEYLLIGDNGVAVPTHYFKIVVTKVAGAANTWEGMAFLFPNEEAEGTFEDHLVSIDEIERLTGYDYLAGLADEQENPLEAAVAAHLLN